MESRLKDRFPSVVALGLLFALVVATWWAAGHADRVLPIDPPARKTHEMDAWSRHFVMLRTDPAGLAINRLEGDYARHYPDDGSYDIDQPRALGMRPGNPVSIGTADTATMSAKGDHIVMSGNAHINRPSDANSEELDVRSAQLILLPDKDVVYSDLPAVVLRGRSRMHGTGMRYNNATRRLQVFSASDVEIVPEVTHRPDAAPKAHSSQIKP